MKIKDMLAEVIRRAVLKPREKEDFVDLWDCIHRFNKVSDRQKAWIEKVYFGQKLDQPVSTVRRRVIVPTWQPERRKRHVDLRPVEDGVDTLTEAAVRLVPPPTNATSDRQPARMVTVRSTDIKRMQGRTSGRAPVNPRPASKSGTYKAVVPEKAHQIGFINYDGAPRELLITNMQTLRDLCPKIQPGSVQYRKIDAFFRAGGKVLKVKPSEDSKVA